MNLAPPIIALDTESHPAFLAYLMPSLMGYCHKRLYQRHYDISFCFIREFTIYNVPPLANCEVPFPVSTKACATK